MNKEITRNKYIIPTLAAVFTAALLIKNSELAMNCVRRGLESCFLTVIPSLFPFMVISEILCACGALDFFGKLFGKRAGRIFGISGGVIAAVLSGLLLGFPIGTRALIRLYDSQEISREELERTVGFCGIPSFGFIANAIGLSLFSSKTFGLVMYAAAIVSAILTAIVWTPRKNEHRFYTPKRVNKKSSAEIITGAISSATGATVTLCAYVIFFSTLVGCLSSIGFSGIWNVTASSLLELSAGAEASAELGGLAGMAFCGFTIGWSGLSVHFQAMALLSDRVRSYRTYFLQKLFQGALCSVAAVAFCVLTHFEPLSPADITVFAPSFTPEYSTIAFISFFFCILVSKKELFPIYRR